MDKYRLVGYITKSKGLKGILKCSFEVFFFDFLDDIDELPYLYIDKGGQILPYFLAYIDTNSNTPIIKFEEINTRSEAEALHHSKLYFDAERLRDYQNPVEGFDALLGYTILSVPAMKTTEEEAAAAPNLSPLSPTPIGKIEEIIYLPGHELAQIIYQGKDVLIPISEELIININEKEKTLTLFLADGLLEL